jgi:hypothetical protein
MDSEFDAKLTIRPRLYRLILVERQNQDLDCRGKARQMQFVTCLGPTHRRVPQPGDGESGTGRGKRDGYDIGDGESGTGRGKRDGYDIGDGESGTRRGKRDGDGESGTGTILGTGKAGRVR